MIEKAVSFRSSFFLLQQIEKQEKPCKNLGDFPLDWYLFLVRYLNTYLIGEFYKC